MLKPRNKPYTNTLYSSDRSKKSERNFSGIKAKHSSILKKKTICGNKNYSNGNELVCGNNKITLAELSSVAEIFPI
ncbi:hypothetical protein GCM10022291_34790 [Postechiella marina]|uniref:Uncharacterized protein n=1 Tax=Postechiella marina TaxID=943941 RepID=A0ABP8CIE9_9FLAO